jgi:hypothetical protein
MEKNYTREELEKSKVAELKQILKNRDLAASGKKNELVERILKEQSSMRGKESPSLREEGSYFSLLPSDITKIVSKYQVENEPNNLIVRELLEKFLDDYATEKRRKKINILLADFDVPYRIELNKEWQEIYEKANEIAKEDNEKFVDVARKLGLYEMQSVFIVQVSDNIIADNSLIKFIAAVLRQEKWHYEFINEALRKFESGIIIHRIDIGPKEGQKKARFIYQIGYCLPEEQFYL